MRSRILPVLILVALVASLSLSAQAAGAKTTLRYLDWQLAEEPQGTAVRELIAAFEKENPDISVQLESVPYADMDVRFMTQSKAGAAPDVFRAVDQSITNLMDKGYLLNLEPFIREAGGEAFKAGFYPALRQLATYEGAMYGLPAWGIPMMLVYNTDMFSRSGLDPKRAPANWSEFLEVCKKLTRDLNGDGKVDQWGYAIRGEKTASSTMRLVGWFFRNGASILNADNTRAQLNSPEGTEAFKFVTELYTKHGVVPPGIPEATGGYIHNVLGQEKVGMVQAPLTTLLIVENENPKLSGKLMLAPMPAGKLQTTTLLSGIYTISARSQHAREAWRLIQYLTSTRSQLKCYTVGGMLPSRVEPGSAQEVVTSRFGKVLADQMTRLTNYPHIPEWPQISDVIMEALHAAVAGRAPEEALTQAAERINAILKAK